MDRWRWRREREEACPHGGRRIRAGGAQTAWPLGRCCSRRLSAPGVPRRLRPGGPCSGGGRRMKYHVTVLPPTIVGSGEMLAPVDYMVWRDQVNVLDQARIFKLLAKGPRLESYLTQLSKATRLDFASWGGFAQN